MTERVQYLNALCVAYGVAALYVFGSRADEVYTWLNDPTLVLAAGPSDVDISVQLPPMTRWTVQQKVAFAQLLEDFFGVNVVDLGVLNEVDPFLAANVIRGNRLYARSRYEADEYELYVLRRAGDLIPLARERMAFALRIPQ